MNITNIMNTIALDNIFDDDTNKIIINYLEKQHSWYLDADSYNKNLNCDIENHSDTGMLLLSYSTEQSQYMNQHNTNINGLGTLILDKILMKIKPLQFNNLRLNRFLWNYYNKASTGISHSDMTFITAENYCSIIYYLNTCDGYTMIGDKKYESKSGSCVIFDSKIKHRGIGPTSDKKRFVLNIMFSYSDIVGI